FVFEHLKLDPERFWVSVFAGDPELKLGEDAVAYRKWEEIGQPTERIVLLPASENFWSVGGPGPCGPDTEMYYDWGVEHGCGEPDCRPACTRCERFLEFWNLVFMEFEQRADGTLTPLPKQNVDTGMGVERTAAILQNVRTVYETDGYQAIMRWIAGESGVAYGDSPEATKAHRILADHGRGMPFLAADGVAPSNEGRGYVMRRIVRRAVQQAGRIGLEPPFLAGLADVVVDQMGDAYPELAEHRAEVHRILAAEEERFSQTLARGMRLFEEVAKGKEISGEDAFKLFESPFYPEGGGQVSDAGFIENESTGARAELVKAIRLEDDQILRFQGEGFHEGDRARAVVPWPVRFPTMANHTATHLLHKALQDVLGDHVRQAGSAVRPDKLRFDFTHPQALSPEERVDVERRVNEKVFENLPVHAFVTPIDEARRLGAMMLFGEKYGEHVRVVEVDGYSRELCGGTHVRSTAEVGPFVVLSESSVG